MADRSTLTWCVPFRVLDTGLLISHSEDDIFQFCLDVLWGSHEFERGSSVFDSVFLDIPSWCLRAEEHADDDDCREEDLQQKWDSELP
jgi:hypothetical protein